MLSKLFEEGERKRDRCLGREGRRDRCFWEGEKARSLFLGKEREARYDQEKQEIFFMEARTYGRIINSGRITQHILV